MALVIFDVNDGSTGATGATGATGPQGPEGLVWRSTYNAATAYVIDDAVAYLGESFVCVQAGTGQATSNAAYWAKLAAKGTTGDTGAAGPQGATGNTGSQGATGNTGSQGGTGNTGSQGIQGEKGMDWKGAYNNATAYSGDDVTSEGGKTFICIQPSTGNNTGNASYWSLVADDGDDGATGATGAAGATGATGAAGDDGDDGATGATGAAGATGAQGATGSQGATGAAGATGAQGATGAAGPGTAMTVDGAPIGVAQYMTVDSIQKTVTFSIDAAGLNGIQMQFP